MRVAAVGAETARALRGAGAARALVPDASEQRQEGLVTAFASIGLAAGTRVLFPQALGGRGSSCATSSYRGAAAQAVDVVAVSQTLPVAAPPPRHFSTPRRSRARRHCARSSNGGPSHRSTPRSSPSSARRRPRPRALWACVGRRAARRPQHARPRAGAGGPPPRRRGSPDIMSFPDTRPRPSPNARFFVASCARRRSRRTTSSFRCSWAWGKVFAKRSSSLLGQFHFSVDMLAREAKGDREARHPRRHSVRFVREGRTRSAAKRGTTRASFSARSAPSKRPSPTSRSPVDACFCEYTTHGHCGVIKRETGELDNDASLENLSRAAPSYARAGADVVAPSGMLDGFVGFPARGSRRRELRQRRDPLLRRQIRLRVLRPVCAAADSTPAFGDRQATRWIPRTCAKRREVALDVEEGAGIVMVKLPRSPTSTSSARCATEFDSAGRRVQRVGRIRDGQSRRRKRLARPRPRYARDAAVDPRCAEPT